MIKVIIYLLLSFILDGVLSLYLTHNLLNPLLTITSLIVIYRLFEREEKLYFIIVMIMGLLFDIFYTDTLILNLFVFFLLGLFIKFMNIYLANNFMSFVVKFLLGITCYRLITYIILSLVNYKAFDIMILLTSIYSSIIINLIYLIISYFIFKKEKEF